MKKNNCINAHINRSKYRTRDTICFSKKIYNFRYIYRRYDTKELGVPEKFMELCK